VLISLRASDTKRSQTGQQRRRVFRVLKTAAFALAPIVLATSPAYAGSTATNTATLPIAVRSLTITPATATFGGCQVLVGGVATPTTGLVIPGGTCSIGSSTAGSVADGITITNGGVPGHIYVSGGPAVPSDAGKDWAIGPATAQDTYKETTFSTSSSHVIIATASCDTSFDSGPVAGCAASAAQSQTEGLNVVAPTSSTDTASSFTITTTWTAVP
jgi:hypothetical protein